MVVKVKGDRYSAFWSRAECHTQPKPFVKPLPYSLRAGKQWGHRRDILNFVPLANGAHSNRGGVVVTASNRALKKVYDRMEQASDLLVAWKERQSTLDLVTNNVRRLVTIARAVKRRDPRIVRRVLRRNPSAKDVIRTPAGLWLEYHFAIAPTIMDIHHALGLFSFEFPVDKFCFTGGAEAAYTARDQGTYRWYESWEQSCRVKIGGEIYALDPNLSLASRLGFGQPLSVAWEMTPFSWFVDYFVNVGDLLTNLEPRFPGVEVRNKYTSTFEKTFGSIWYRNREHPFDAVSEKTQYEGTLFTRTTSWPNFQLEFSSPFDLKAQQCSYIVAVLGNILTSMKK